VGKDRRKIGNKRGGSCTVERKTLSGKKIRKGNKKDMRKSACGKNNNVKGHDLVECGKEES